MPRRAAGGSARGKSSRRAAGPGESPDAPDLSRDLAFLEEASRKLLGPLDLPDVLAGVGRSLLDLVPASRVGVLLLDKGRLRLASGCARGPFGEVPRGQDLDLARHPEVARAIETRETVVVSDVARDDVMGAASHDAAAAGVGGLLVIPLVVKDRCLGVLSLAQAPGARGFTDRERHLVAAVANLAAAAVRNAELFRDLQAAARQLERKVDDRTRRLEEAHLRLTALTQVTFAIHASLDLEPLIESTLQGILRVPGTDLVQAYLLDTSGEPALDAWELGPDGRLRHRRVPTARGETPSRILFALDGRPVDFGEGQPPVTASLLVPLVSKDAVIGAIQVVARKGQLGAEDQALLEQVSGELSLAVERSQLYSAAQERTAQFKVISEIGHRLTSAALLEDLHPTAARLIQRSLGWALVAILGLSEDASEVVVSGASAADPDVERGAVARRLPAGGAPWSRVLATGEPGPAPGEASPFAREDVAELLVPIRVSGQTLGLLLVQRAGRRPFSGDDVALVRTLADQLAAALNLSRLFEDLQRGREFTERVINNLTGGLLVTDRRGVVQVANQRGAEMLRVDRDELLGRELLEVFPTAAPLFEYSPDAVSRECEIVLRDGSRIPLGFSNAFFADSRDRSDAVIITFRDLSEVRELQRKVRHAERLATIGTVAAGVAHEIRNPLFGISATAEILSRELPPGSDLADLCTSMLDETRRLNRLVEGLVSYGKAPSLHLAPEDPCRLWDAVVRQCAPRIDETGARIEHACPATGRTVDVDSDGVKQVLLNLLLNALDVTAPGGVIRLAVQWSGDGDDVTLSIEDEGPGLPAGEVDRVFDLFYTTKPRGSGLGLAISSRIVEDHGGTLTCGPAPGRGARFEVHLPASGPSPGRSPRS